MEGGGGVGGEGAAGVVDEVYGGGAGAVGMGVDEGFATLEAHNHVGCGHGVGEPALALYYGGAEEGVLHGTSRGGIDGVGVAHAVALVVFAVATRGDDGAVVDGDGGLHLPFAVAVGGGTLDTYRPGAAVGFDAVADDLAADVDEVGGDAASLEVLRHEVGGVALGDGVEVEFCGRVLLAETEGAVDSVDGYRGACGAKETVEGGAVEFLALAEAEAPGLYEAADATVEGTVGIAPDAVGIDQ